MITVSGIYPQSNIHNTQKVGFAHRAPKLSFEESLGIINQGLKRDINRNNTGPQGPIVEGVDKVADTVEKVGNAFTNLFRGKKIN